MGRKIGVGTQEVTPVVQVKEKAGNYFVGLKVDQKQLQNGGFVFTFNIKDGTASTAKPTGNKITKNGRQVNEYAACDVKVDDKVAIFGDTQLNSKLTQVNIGETVKIVFNGLKFNSKTGRSYNDYDVEVL
jgi:hypothetical protein